MNIDTLVRQGKALYVGISSYSAERTAEAVAVAKDLGTPLVIHQPAYSILNRWVEDGLTEVLREEGMGAIAFTPEWRGNHPPQLPVGIAGLKGCDVAPVDLTDPAQAMRLKAYIWPEHRIRFARMEAAIAAAKEKRPNLKLVQIQLKTI